MTMRPNKLHLSIFIVVTLLSGWLGVGVDSLLKDRAQEESLGMLIWLVLPLFTAIILRTIARDWKGFGLAPNFKGNAKWYLTAVFIYPCVTLIMIAVASMLGCINWPTFQADTFLSLAVTSMIINLFKNIFEEFSWRGYLTPSLLSLKLNDWLVYLISGLVWSLWHAAYYLVFLPDSYFETISRIGMVLIGCVLMTCWTMMFVEMYRLTKSVWPCLLMHAVEDAVPTVLVATGGFVTFTKGSDAWLNPIHGIAATVLFLAVGFVLRTIRIKKEHADALKSPVHAST